MTDSRIKYNHHYQSLLAQNIYQIYTSEDNLMKEKRQTMFVLHFEISHKSKFKTISIFL